MRKALITAAIAATAAVSAATTFALAAAPSQASQFVYHGCVAAQGSTPPRVLFDVYVGHAPVCPAGSFSVSWVSGP